MNTDDIFPEKMRASCSRTILSTNSLLVRRFPCSSLIADRLPFFLSDLLTNAQNCPGCGKKIQARKIPDHFKNCPQLYFEIIDIKLDNTQTEQFTLKPG